jgi:hypothetical protein
VRSGSVSRGEGPEHCAYFPRRQFLNAEILRPFPLQAGRPDLARPGSGPARTMPRETALRRAAFGRFRPLSDVRKRGQITCGPQMDQLGRSLLDAHVMLRRRLRRPKATVFGRLPPRVRRIDLCRRCHRDTEGAPELQTDRLAGLERSAPSGRTSGGESGKWGLLYGAADSGDLCWPEDPLSARRRGPHGTAPFKGDGASDDLGRAAWPVILLRPLTPSMPTRMGLVLGGRCKSGFRQLANDGSRPVADCRSRQRQRISLKPTLTSGSSRQGFRGHRRTAAPAHRRAVQQEPDTHPGQNGTFTPATAAVAF